MTRRKPCLLGKIGDVAKEIEQVGQSAFSKHLGKAVIVLDEVGRKRKSSLDAATHEQWAAIEDS